MAESAIPPVDYTSRDYASIREDMLDSIAPRVPEWTSRNPNDFGIVLIEVFAQMGDMLSFYADRIANEAFLPTATQRSSVLQLAKLLDYRPGGNIAATVALSFVNALAEPATIPRGSKVTTTAVQDEQVVTITFETDAEVVVPANGTATVMATEGVTVPGELVATSDGSLDQRYALFNAPVIEGSVKVYVNESGAPALWTYLEHIVDAGPLDTVYTLDVDENDIVYVIFGDGVSGKIPNPAAVISADYRVGGGTIGNVGPATLTRIASALPAGLTVTNPEAAVGGGDAETLDEIRLNAPRSLFTLDRAVTLDDYSNLAIRVDGIAKAKTISAVQNSVTIYVAPVGGGGLNTDGTPTASFAAAKDRVRLYLSDKAPASTSVTVADPAYIKTNVSVTVTALPQFSQEATRSAVTAALAELFAFDNVAIGDRFTVSDIYAAMTFVAGVDYAVVTLLARQDQLPLPAGTQPSEVLYGNHEIPVLGDVTITVAGGIQ